jgi:hypothetical protein
MSEIESLSDNITLPATTSLLTRSNHWDHFLSRVGVNRMGHLVQPGLYILGHPTPDSPVFVSANYTLSFDALRSALAGVDGYILVLDTKGVNVWCAAGEGTFGTDELVNRIEVTHLSEIVRTRVLILPQLGAPGIVAHEVKQRSGFRVEYGPVRAADVPAYLKTHRATPEMRRVQFTLADRMTVALVDIVATFLPMAVIALVMYFLSGLTAALAVVMIYFAGEVLFPALLPFIPTREFSSKGFLLGLLAAIPFALATYLRHPAAVWWLHIAGALVYLLVMPPAVAFLALMFTGSTTFTSRTGVRREIFTYTPVMAWTFGAGILLFIGLTLALFFGVTL